MGLQRAASTLLPSLEHLIYRTIGSCLEVHRRLGPGMAEVVYSRACRMELSLQGLTFEVEKAIPVRYRGELLCRQRVDLLVEHALVLELKSVERIHAVHVAQVVGYLRLLELRAGLIVNFNVPVLKQGIRRVVL